MKRILTVTLLACMLFTVNGFGQGFTVKGHIDGVTDAKVTLQVRGGDKFATGLDNKGNFTLTGKVTEPNYYSLTVEGVRGGVALFLQNAEFTVKAKKTNNGRYDVLEAEEVTGGAAQKVWQKYQDASKAWNEEFSAATADFMTAYRAGEEEKWKKLEPQYDAAYEKLTEHTLDFIKENSDCSVAAFLLYQQAGRMDDPAKLEGLYNLLDAQLAGLSYTEKIKETLKIKKLTAVGQMAPAFTQNDPDGNPVSLSDFQGKVVLVDFWASWCGPCRKENPNVVAAFKKFNKKGFTVLGVSLDRPNDKDKWLKAIEDDGLTWTHVSDLQFWDNAVAKQYGIRSIPSNLLIGKDGKILAKNLRGEDLQNELAKQLR